MVDDTDTASCRECVHGKVAGLRRNVYSAKAVGVAAQSAMMKFALGVQDMPSCAQWQCSAFARPELQGSRPRLDRHRFVPPCES